MDAVAESYLSRGDVKAAALFYGNLMVLHPKYVKMARVCRVLANPFAVPQPHRYADIVEALLEPLVTPEVLFGVGASSKDVNKTYQSLTILVHPDKNPYPKAGDAFNRLSALKTLALEMAENAKEGSWERTCMKGGGHCNGRYEDKVSNAHLPRKRRAAQEFFFMKSAEIDIKLSEMKKTQVRLKSLKRKDIDDKDLPELKEVFRSVRERRFGSRISSPLSRTAPCVATGISASSNTCSFGSTLRQSHCSSTPNTSSVSANTTVLKADVQKMMKDVCVSSPPFTTTTSFEGLSLVAEEAEGLESSVTEEDSSCQEDSQMQMKPNNQLQEEQESQNKEQQLVVGDANTETSSVRVTVSSVDKFKTVTEATSPSTPGTNTGASFDEAVKGSIRELIYGLQKVRANRTRLKLNCDLTFAAYEKEMLKKKASLGTDIVL